MSKITVARALTAYFSRRIIRFATLLVLIIFVVVALSTAALVYFFTPWWWLLLIPFVLLLGLFFLVRLILLFIVGRIHTERLTNTQNEALEQFVDKVQSLLEARATPWPLIVLICIKDLIIHRDIITVKKAIRDSASLMADYKQLETLF